MRTKKSKQPELRLDEDAVLPCIRKNYYLFSTNQKHAIDAITQAIQQEIITAFGAQLGAVYASDDRAERLVEAIATYVFECLASGAPGEELPANKVAEPETVLDEDMVERIVAAVVAEYEAEDSDWRVSRTLLRNAINLATQKPLHVWAAFRDGQECQYRIIQVRDINDTTGVGMVLQTQYRVGGARSWCVLEDTSPICEDLVRLAQLQPNARTAEPD